MDRSRSRLAVLAVLLGAMLLVLVGRTVQLQAGTAAQAAAAAELGRIRTVVEPAPRGRILDRAGRPLAATRQQVGVVADLAGLPRDGAQRRTVLAAAARVLGEPVEQLEARLVPCGDPAAVRGACWSGQDPTSVPLARDVPLEAALPFLQEPERFPGIAVTTVTARSYPMPAGARAPHLLGHLGAANEQEVSAGAAPWDLFGRGGLEQQYDQLLRGEPGERVVLVDPAGRPANELRRTLPRPGATLVTSIDAALQAVAERELAGSVQRARAAGLPADSGAAVVIDVADGRVLALASYPDYEPALFEKPVSEEVYRQLSESGALRFNPVMGRYAPGSTMKPFTVVGMQRAGIPLDARAPCPASVVVGGREFGNFESRSYGEISIARALEVSCNTAFYRAAADLWSRGADGPLYEAARDFGLSGTTGIDLPGEAAGVADGPDLRRAEWEANRERWCAAAEAGYPQLRATDPFLADQYTEVDRENCVGGGEWRVGDAMNASVGQGRTEVTPLQLAMAYAAIANGGVRYRPQLVTSVIHPDGRQERVEPVAEARVPVPRETLAFLTEAMVGVTARGTASGAFAGFPLQLVPVAGKTGSAQVSGGRIATSWFASFAPATSPRYAVVVMVTQGGTGASTAAPAARGIYEALFGVMDGGVDPARAVLAAGEP